MAMDGLKRTVSPSPLFSPWRSSSVPSSSSISMDDEDLDVDVTTVRSWLNGQDVPSRGNNTALGNKSLNKSEPKRSRRIPGRRRRSTIPGVFLKSTVSFRNKCRTQPAGLAEKKTDAAAEKHKVLGSGTSKIRRWPLHERKLTQKTKKVITSGQKGNTAKKKGDNSTRLEVARVDGSTQSETVTGNSSDADQEGGEVCIEGPQDFCYTKLSHSYGGLSQEISPDGGCPSHFATNRGITPKTKCVKFDDAINSQATLKSHDSLFTVKAHSPIRRNEQLKYGSDISTTIDQIKNVRELAAETTSRPRIVTASSESPPHSSRDLNEEGFHSSSVNVRSEFKRQLLELLEFQHWLTEKLISLKCELDNKMGTHTHEVGIVTGPGSKEEQSSSGINSPNNSYGKEFQSLITASTSVDKSSILTPGEVGGVSKTVDSLGVIGGVFQGRRRYIEQKSLGIAEVNGGREIRGRTLREGGGSAQNTAKSEAHHSLFLTRFPYIALLILVIFQILVQYYYRTR